MAEAVGCRGSEAKGSGATPGDVRGLLTYMYAVLRRHFHERGVLGCLRILSVGISAIMLHVLFSFLIFLFLDTGAMLVVVSATQRGQRTR